MYEAYWLHTIVIILLEPSCLCSQWELSAMRNSVSTTGDGTLFVLGTESSLRVIVTYTARVTFILIIYKVITRNA